MVGMGRHRKPKPVDATASPKPSTGRKGHQLPARAGDALWKLLQEVARRERRKVAPMVLLLLEEALRARGLDVPTPEAE